MKNISFKIMSLLAAFFFSATFSAQKIDARAKQLLDDVAQQYKSKNNVYFKFIFGTGSGNKVNKTEHGIFYAAKDKYKLKIMGTEQIFDGSKVYNISSEDQEITISKPTAGSEMFSPLTYVEAYKNGYNVKYMGKIKVNGFNTDYILLTPTKNTGIRQVKLFVNAARKQLVKLEQYTTDNAVSVIAISDYKENQNLSSGTFTFDKSQYANYMITEL